MLIEGSNAAVIGGSIAGCAAAIALSRAGCSVTVYEAARGDLHDEGMGIPIPSSARDDLVAAGYLDPAMHTRRRDEVTWLTRDAESLAGWMVGRQKHSSTIVSWGLVWRHLRERLPAGMYHDGSPVTAIRPDPQGVTLEIAGGRDERFDIVLGADGHRSQVRRIVAPEAGLSQAEYGMWRGGFPAERLSGIARSRFTQELVAVGFAGGHALFYLSPDPQPGRLRQNWAIYGPVPAWAYQADPAWAARDPLGEGAIEFLHGLVDDQFPPSWAEVVRRTRPSEITLSPVYDVSVSACAAGRLLLIGDAGTLVRPHIGVGPGAVKALQDACVLERACRENRTWESGVAVYDAERSTVGTALTELGKYLGRMQVEAAPDWPAMTPERFTGWTRANVEGWRATYGHR